MLHIFKTKVYVSDTDAGGVVYFANYAKFCEHARSEFLADIGFTQMDMLKQLGVGFMVSKTIHDFKAPAFLEDKLIIATQLSTMTKTSLCLDSKIYKTSIESKPISLVTTTLVCVNATTLRPIAIPEIISDALKQTQAI